MGLMMESPQGALLLQEAQREAALQHRLRAAKKARKRRRFERNKEPTPKVKELPPSGIEGLVASHRDPSTSEESELSSCSPHQRAVAVVAVVAGERHFGPCRGSSEELEDTELEDPTGREHPRRKKRIMRKKRAKRKKMMERADDSLSEEESEHFCDPASGVTGSGKAMLAVSGSQPDVLSDPQIDPQATPFVARLTRADKSQNNPELTDDLLSREDEEEGSCGSSRMSAKSEKNMADFEGEESACEAELVQLAHQQAVAQAQQQQQAQQQMQQQQRALSQGLGVLASPGSCLTYPRQGLGIPHHALRKSSHHHHHHHPGSVLCIPGNPSSRGPENFDMQAVCEPGQTLLWDLLQDDKIEQLGEGLAIEAEKVLCNLVCWSSHKVIRMKFIEGCLHNLAQDRSVLVSLRILPKLLGSFQQFRGHSDTHSVTLWAEKDHNMMKHFFSNLSSFMAFQPVSSSSTKITTTAMSTGSISSGPAMYSQTEQIQVRLHFLSCIFSSSGSPENFRLSQEQVDTLWECLAGRDWCWDELFSWLLQQARSPEQHALSMDLFKHVLLEKMPQLAPETTSMTALALLQQLSSLARLATASYDTPSSEADVCGIRQLWGIALKAQNTDVSMAAIQNLNNYYINVHHGTLEKEEEFIKHCMDSLHKASSHIREAEESNLMVIQRALLLLKTHIDTFQKRYAYHLRRWHLAGEGIHSHRASLGEKLGIPIRVVCQPAGMAEKKTLTLLSSDYVADLRAEVSYWWEQRKNAENACPSSSGGIPLALVEGPIRMISQGQEMSSELDEKTLSEMGFKDLQLVFVSVGAARPSRRREGALEPASTLPPPPRERLPTVLLLGSPYFDLLFCLMQQLGELKTVNRAGVAVGHTKAQVLSRRVWEILMMLPTSPTILKGLQDVSLDCSIQAEPEPTSEAQNKEETKGSESEAQQQQQHPALVTLQSLLNPSIPQKLMYSMQIIEALRHDAASNPLSTPSIPPSSGKSGEKGSPTSGKQTPTFAVGTAPSSWSKKFVEHGGLRHLFDIFMSGLLQSRDGECWNEWHQDCLASLLSLLYQFGLLEGEDEAVTFDLQMSAVHGPLHPHHQSLYPRGPLHLPGTPLPTPLMAGPLGMGAPNLPGLSGIKGTNGRLQGPNKRLRRGSTDNLMVPRLNQTMLNMMGQVEPVLKVLLTILYEAALPADPNQYRTGFWGRSQVVHCAVTILVSWALCQPQVKDKFFLYPSLDTWLKRLVLDDPEPSVRREVCTGLYRLCLGTTSDGVSGHSFVAPLLARLMKFLSVAQSMRPPRPDEEEKEPYGPGCKDYFWLVCRLVDSLEEEELAEHRQAVEDVGQEAGSLLDLDHLARYLAQTILSRDFRETRPNGLEDDGLRGLLSLATAVMKHGPPFKASKEGKEFLLHILDCLFLLPSPQQRHLPRCKTPSVRSSAFDLLVEMVKGSKENYQLLHEKLLLQHSPESHDAYPWDYWPQEDGRSECGYVGLTNLGATCYLASCMQHLYMMPQARHSILSAVISSDSKHENTLKELQKMFAYLLESERKAYNPRSFCKVYTMDHQPLNTGEQKDMAEFFTDLISKLEEMTPQLDLVKTLFCGIISNNVVSLDCPHISRTLEEFYTLRCQVADMRNLYESLDELTVKDTLEGDNMYTCSQCGKKARAEKRACIKKLPHILCFNTMRYTFNMVTMTKEKVNTHFSFPLRLDMGPYMEENLMAPRPSDEVLCSPTPSTPSSSTDIAKETLEDPLNYEYELIGVTVHTGTADGGHYYSFIRERQHQPGMDKWFLFNDAEVKPFDPTQIAAECFGGEMTSKTYDNVTEKFMDFSFEKTNSAYMLFYEHVTQKETPTASTPGCVEQEQTLTSSCVPHQHTFELSPELAEWIWKDNMQFIQDRNLFEHTYFNFMWQMCGYIPHALSQGNPDITLYSAKLGTSFVLETLIHAKEKPTIAQWIELLTKQFNASQAACEWFLDHMAGNECWPVQILLKCPNQVVRQLFQRLCIHVINQLKPIHSALYLQPYLDGEASSVVDMDQIGQYSCVTRFIRKLLQLVEQGAKQFLTEYFAFLLEFAKMGEEECQFLLSIQAISSIVHFYLGQKASTTTDFVEVTSEEEEEEEEEVLASNNSANLEEKCKPASLEKMVTLLAILVEKARGQDQRLHLSPNDMAAVAAGKGFPFLYQQIKDSINLRQTCALITSLCRWNDHLAVHIVNMLFTAITKQQEASGPFFKVLSLLVDFVGQAPGMPTFTTLILQRIWETAEYCPQQCLDWLTAQVPRNKLVHNWVLQSMDTWVERFLIAHNVQRVRCVAAVLLVCLVPNNHFRQAFRTARSLLAPLKEMQITSEALMTMHQIYDLLLRLLKRARNYVDPAVHSTTKLMSYFALMTYCLISKTEKLMFSPYFLDLWNLFQPKLSEPAISVHHNKQALLIFWYQVCVDCPENVKLIVHNTHITKNIAFNYILADHDDQDVIVFNRCMLPAYYGLLRLCCSQSTAFTRQLASHQNIQWAFKNITPYTTQYTAAISELFKLMRLFVSKSPGGEGGVCSEQELHDIEHFKCTTLQLYLSVIDARSCWATLVNALRILMDTTQDRLFVICHNGLTLLFQAFHSLHLMYHEATACHVTSDLVEVLSIALDLLKCARNCRTMSNEVHAWLTNWKDRGETLHKLLTLLNSYAPNDLRHSCIEVLQELALLYPENTLGLVVPLLANCHVAFQENNTPVPPGPFFPHQGQKLLSKSNVRPQRPMLQMFLHPSQLQVAKGMDDVYDHALLEFFLPYHQFVDMLCRMAITQDLITEELVNLSAILAIEGAPLHLAIFPKLWLDIYHSEVGGEFLQLLFGSSYLVDYMEAVLLDERTSLNNPIIYQFFSALLPKMASQVINEQMMQLVMSLVTSLASERVDCHAAKLSGDLRALTLVFAVEKIPPLPEEFLNRLRRISAYGEKKTVSDKKAAAEESDKSKTIESDATDAATNVAEEEQEPSTSAKEELSSTSGAPGGSGTEENRWPQVVVKCAKALLGVIEAAG